MVEMMAWSMWSMSLMSVVVAVVAMGDEWAIMVAQFLPTTVTETAAVVEVTDSRAI